MEKGEQERVILGDEERQSLGRKTYEEKGKESVGGTVR